MPRITPPDEAQRDKILTELKTNFLVEAGAGSGKTDSLVKRMIAQIIAGNFKASEIAAVTFTRKAAVELRERFKTKLEIDQSFTGTIHAFCGQLLRERPVEAGVDPEFKELDELGEALLIEEAWNSYLLEVKLHQQTLLYQLHQLGENYPIP